MDKNICSICGFTDHDTKLFHELDVNLKKENLCNSCYGDYIADQEDKWGEPEEV